MPLQIGWEFLFGSKSTVIALLHKTVISKLLNYTEPQIKTQGLFSVKRSQDQEIFHTKQNLNRTIYISWENLRQTLQELCSNSSFLLLGLKRKANPLGLLTHGAETSILLTQYKR